MLFSVIEIYLLCLSSFFFFNDTATTEIYTLSLHDALPISACRRSCARRPAWRPLSQRGICRRARTPGKSDRRRSEEHTSELQSRSDLVCRLLLEKKKTKELRILTEYIVTYHSHYA